jgi:hypothetical protein
MSNSDRLLEALAPLFGDERERRVDVAAIDGMIDRLTPLTAPKFTGAMVGQGTVAQTFDDIEGLRAGWHEWLEMFESVRFATEGLEQIGENFVLFARQIGTTRHGVEVEQPSAAVWKFEDGLMTRAEFHLNRAAALASAAEPA